LEPKIIIPMHYKQKEKKDLETAERFLKEMGVKGSCAPTEVVREQKQPAADHAGCEC